MENQHQFSPHMFNFVTDFSNSVGKQPVPVFLNFLIILLLMSPHGRAATELHSQPRLATEIYQTGTEDTSHVQNGFLLVYLQSFQVPHSKFLFPLRPVRLKDQQVLPRDLSIIYQAQTSQSSHPFQLRRRDGPVNHHTIQNG